MNELIHPDYAIRPFMKWPGGKSAELPGISEFAPASFTRFIDPFLGGGSVLFAVINDVPACCNDICPELIDLMQAPQNRKLKDLLFAFVDQWADLKVKKSDLEKITKNFGSKEDSKVKISFKLAHLEKYEFHESFLAHMEKRVAKDLLSKMARTEKIQKARKIRISEEDFEATIEGILRGGFYMTIRHFYNELRGDNLINPLRTVYFFFLRELSYAAMFRFNASGGFNVPYGGISYNQKDLKAKISTIFEDPMKSRLLNTNFFSVDYQEFLKEIKPKKNDFIFVDPPYDSVFSNYDNRDFLAENQRELEEILRGINSQIMIVIGASPLIRKLYGKKHWKITETKKNYAWNIKSRNDGRVVHLVITNY